MNCRSCGNSTLDSIIPLGHLPLANGFLTKKQAQEPSYNLEVLLCSGCGLAQLRNLIDPKDLFSDYLYFSSNSEGMLQSVAELVKRIEPTLSKESLVIEIASNDGYLLKNYKTVDVLGIDPAANIAKVANEAGIPTLCDFFSEALAHRLIDQGKQADIIHANNVMAHVPDINGFVKGVQLLLKKTGQAIIEVPHFLDLFQKLEFDTIYHEHVYYFGLKPLLALFQRHGMDIFDVEKISMHGGTLRLYIGHQGERPIDEIVEHIIAQEEQMKLYDVDSYQNFMDQLLGLRRDLISLLKEIKAGGKNIAAYGASAKGTTLLNYFGIGRDLIDFVVDRSSVKQGKFTPGTQLEIYAPEHLENADYALLLAWNFAEEIMQQQRRFVTQGGQFILPLPDVKVLS